MKFTKNKIGGTFISIPHTRGGEPKNPIGVMGFNSQFPTHVGVNRLR